MTTKITSLIIALLFIFPCVTFSFNRNEACSHALISAVIGGDTTQVAEILGNQPPASCINSKSSIGFTALIYAADFGYIAIVKELLKHGANPNIGNKYGVTALMMASVNGYTNIVIELIKNKADPNLANKYGVTPLMYASRTGYIDVIEVLLKYGANPNVRDNNNRTALFIAQKKNRDVVAEKLKEAGAKL